RMQRFFQLDLETDSLECIPDDFFDVIICSHVIEHVHNGLTILASLARKMKPGGVIYVEFPGPRSFSTPRARRGCSHFPEDPTHVRAYALVDVINSLLDEKVTILKAGTRRDMVRLALSPASFVAGLLRGSPWNRSLWDIFGFAEFVYAAKR